MLTRLTIVLSDEERIALQKLCEQEMRGMKDQARYLLRAELEHQGLLDAEPKFRHYQSNPISEK
jgi:hypothetical protein